jgi:hypothetical protein
MDLFDDGCALADRRSNPFCRSRPNVADCEYAGAAGLQWERRAAIADNISAKLSTGHDETLLI